MKSSATKKVQRPRRPRNRSITRQSSVHAPQRTILSKMRDLPPDKVADVEDFIDFLWQRQGDRPLTRAAVKLAERAFEDVWDNPEYAAYDRR